MRFADTFIHSKTGLFHYGLYCRQGAQHISRTYASRAALMFTFNYGIKKQWQENSSQKMVLDRNTVYLKFTETLAWNWVVPVIVWGANVFEALTKFSHARTVTALSCIVIPLKALAFFSLSSIWETIQGPRETEETGRYVKPQCGRAQKRNINYTADRIMGYFRWYIWERGIIFRVILCRMTGAHSVPGIHNIAQQCFY